MKRQRYVLIVNPWGGRGKGLPAAQRAKFLLEQAGTQVELIATEAPGHAATLVRTLDLDDCAGLCLVGGDGTLHEAVNGLMQRERPSAIPIGVVPGGTGNSVGWHLGYRTVEQAVEKILASHVRPLDLARVMLPDEIVYCVNIVAWGAAVDINETAERHRWLGAARYTLSPLWHILKPRRRFARLEFDGQASDDEFLFAVACNTRFTGHGMNLAPRADMGDGLLDVVLVRRASRWELLQVFRRVFAGTHVDLPCVEYRQVKRFCIEADGSDRLDLDGELKGRAPFSVDVAPGALRVFV